jgi:DNA mismatch endonuclease (patch repair protein)
MGATFRSRRRMIRYPVPSSASVSATMRANRKRDTRPELGLRSQLHRLGYRFRVNFGVRVQNKLVRPDIVFTKARIAVFVDGCYWHSCSKHGTTPRLNTDYWGPKLERNVSRDREVNGLLTSSGWRVIRIWEHLAVDDAIAQVEGVLLSYRAQMSSPNYRGVPKSTRASRHTAVAAGT